jgi:hypothetical protein
MARSAPLGTLLRLSAIRYYRDDSKDRPATTMSAPATVYILRGPSEIESAD